MGQNRKAKLSRRELGALLGALGGMTGLEMLTSCLPHADAAARAAVDPPLGAFVWVDTIVATPAHGIALGGVGTSTHLRGVTGRDSFGRSRPVAVVGGYANVGDDGGGIFYWSSTEEADDGGTVIVPNKTVGPSTGGSGCWKRVYSGPVSVKWFGARGDTKTDDASAIAQAVAFGAAKQAEIFFPPGVYMVGAPIKLRARLSIRGAGTQWRDNPGSCIRALVPMECVLKLAYADVRIEGLWLDGNFLADNVVVLEYPADNCDFDRVFVTRALPLTTPVDVTRSNLVTVAKGTTIGIAAMNFRGCKFDQDAFGEGGPARTKRGHACVSNYFPGFGAGGSANAFRWLFDEHCTFIGAQYGYRTKLGGATFANSEFYDIEVALFAVEINKPILVMNCYTEPGQDPQSTYPKILLQEESVLGAAGMANAEINFTSCQFNTLGADFRLNGKAPVRIDDCTIGGDVLVEPATSGGAMMPIIVVACSFLAGHGVVDESSYPFLSTLGNFTNGLGAQGGQTQFPRLGTTVFGANSSGAVTITEPATSAKVRFAKAEPDASYRVILRVANTFRPSVATTPYVADLEASGFTIGLAGKLGARQSCEVFWQLTR